MKETPHVIVVAGPTASGKSDFAVEIALREHGEIISADSRQVYKGLDIGTGKITKKEMRGIPHYLLDVVSPKKIFTVADWKKINVIAKKHGLITILDNCDGFGSTLNGKKVETYADISFTSFHAAHIVAMGQGGGVFTNDVELARRVKMYRDWGRQADLTSRTNDKWPDLPKDYDSRFIYEKIGYNLSTC